MGSRTRRVSASGEDWNSSKTFASAGRRRRSWRAWKWWATWDGERWVSAIRRICWSAGQWGVEGGGKIVGKGGGRGGGNGRS
jgi:hypothetical protein